MKKEQASNGKKILKFLLEQQLPDALVAGLGRDGKILPIAGGSGISNLDLDIVAVKAVDHVTQVALETCRCVHLQEHFPHLLDLELCKAVHHPRGWIVANPVHSMHLQTQLEDSVPTMAHDRQPPVLYGEEQQRTMALNTEGIVEYWCPLDGYSAVIHDDTAMEKMEHMPTLQNIQKPSATPSVAASSSVTSRHHHSSSLPAPPLPSSHRVAATASSSSSSAMLEAAYPSKLPGLQNVTSTAAINTSTGGVPSILGSSTITASDIPEAVSTNTEVSKPETNKSSDETPTTAKVLQDKGQNTETPKMTSDDNHKEASSQVSKNTTDSTLPEMVASAAPTSIEQLSLSSAPPMQGDEEDPATATHLREDLSVVPKAAHEQEKNGMKSNTASGVATVNAGIHDGKDGVVAREDFEDASAEMRTEGTAQSADGIKENDALKDHSAAPSEGKGGEVEGQNGAIVVAKSKEDTTGNSGFEDGDEGQGVNDGKDTPIADVVKKQEDFKEAALNAENMDLDTNSPKKGVQQEEFGAEKPVQHTSDRTGENPNEKEEQVVKMETDTETTTKEVPNGETPTPVTSSIHEVSSASIPASDLSAPDATVSNAHPTEGPTVTSIPPPSRITAIPIGEQIPLALPEEKFNHLRIEEDRIRLIRRSLSSHRIVPKKKIDPKKRIDPKNKRKREDLYKATGIPGWHASNPKELTQEQEQQWLEAMMTSRARVERWMDNFRICRETFWDERERQASSSVPTDHHGGFYLPQVEHLVTRRCCEICTARPQGDRYWEGSSKKAKTPPRRFCGDELLQCLECNFVGCSPKSITRDSRQHILEHLLITGHKFAVSCGERGQIFCFCCGDFVYHEVFEQEKARIDYGKKVPLMAWKSHKVYRSFDPFHFMKTQDHGIVWRGLVATYPQLVPHEHIRATEATSRRQDLFNGMVHEEWLANRSWALTFAASQSLLDNESRHRIRAPVGMYNLGNTCYKSAVLQCLVHCQPLQRFFLKENGHHYYACALYRQRDAIKRKKKKTTAKPEDSICLACEMDKLFLSYYGHTIGVDVRAAVEEACSDESSDPELLDESLEKGDPLVISEMLTASWKSGGMNSLASYKQHDSHEFMNSFLEIVAKQTKQHWARVLSSINMVEGDNALVDHNAVENEHDIVKTLFEGSLSSVLLCEECGTKRKRTEEFLNVSLSLSEEVARIQSSRGRTTSDLSVENCLERFVMPEKLGDGVDCPSCAKKTSTQKQHTFGTLPKVLCLHLKRFDAALNKKIDDYVSFPAQGLDMGKYLAQWCEVSSLRSSHQEGIAEPQIYYDLFGTVNHVGNMQSGHYVTSVKVDDRWYNFNDAHVCLAGGDGGEDNVVKNKGAYILFYVRREERPITAI